MAEDPQIPPEEPEQQQEEFESFLWRGQVRYRCPMQWEGGVRCAYNTYNIPDLRAHIGMPHTRDGKPAIVTPRIVLSPILDPKGNPIEKEIKEDPDAQQYRFRY